MQVCVEEKAPRRIKRTSVLQQTAYWSRVKKEQGLKPQAVDIAVPADQLYHEKHNSRITQDDLLLLYQPVGGGKTIGYVPYGPTLDVPEDTQGPLLEELSESLRSLIRPDCIALRYDLPWESPWARDADFYDPDHDWMGPPPETNQEIRLNINTHHWNLKKAKSNVLPSDTILMDLSPPEDEVLGLMKPKTRYNIRLAGRKGVVVKQCGQDMLPVWYQLYRETCERNHIVLHDLAYFETVLNVDARDTLSPAETFLLLAFHEGDPLAGIFLSISDTRATYLYGASTTRKRNLMAAYAVQWEAIRLARAKGCADYDLFGVAPYPNPAHPMYGLYRFKKGFGGHLFHRMGCWDYPLEPDSYHAFQAFEMAAPGYHL